MEGSGVTNDAFLRSKLTNFVQFLRSVLKKHLKSTRYAEFDKKIGELEGVDTAAFLVHILHEMKPYKSAPSQYVAKLLKAEDVDPALLTPDEVARMARYVTCFIEVAEQ